MTTRLIVVRHGNTFAKGETPRRVGARTDLSLTEELRPRSVGCYLKDNNILPDVIFSGPLKRHLETAKLILKQVGLDKEIHIEDNFNEIDYGPDENKTEDEVVARIGQQAIDAWNDDATLPDGWDVDVNEIISAWQDFANEAEQKHKDKNILLVSSNGTIRFAPYITGDFDTFKKSHDIKVATGGICIFEKESNNKNWTCTDWNVSAYDVYKDSLR